MKKLFLAIALPLAGCGSTGGSGSTGSVLDTIGLGTAPYVLLDLQTRNTSFRANLPDAGTNPDYRDRFMVFKRVGSGGSESLIGIFTVTQAQWDRIDPGGTPWLAVPTAVVASSPAPDMPAYGLDYDYIVPVLTSFSISGARLTIPSGAQYETAAGATAGWTWGQDANPAVLAANAMVRETAISESNKGVRLDAFGNDVGGPEPVGRRNANGQGIYDLHGNVWQWTAPGTEVRGGSWHDPASLARIEVRGGAGQGIGPDVPHALIGVRLVLVIQ